MERLFCNMISITCWLLLFLIGILAVPFLIIFQSLESCHFFFFCYGSPAERDSSLENISAQWVKRWENSRHQKKKKTKLIVVWNCGLSMPDVGKPWRWKSHAKEMSWSLESFLIWERGNKWFTSSCTQSFPVFHSSRHWNRCSLPRCPLCFPHIPFPFSCPSF